MEIGGIRVLGITKRRRRRRANGEGATVVTELPALPAPAFEWDGEYIGLFPEFSVGLSDPEVGDTVLMQRSSTSDFAVYSEAEDTVDSVEPQNILEFEFDADWTSGIWYVRIYHIRGEITSPASDTEIIHIEEEGLHANFADNWLTIVDTSSPANDYSGLPSGVLTQSVSANGTFASSAGALTQATSNILRRHYNPSTLASRGVIIEPARTNSFVRSADFSTTWVASQITVVTDQAVAPDGTTSMDLIRPSTSSAGHFIVQSFVGYVSGTSYTLSVFAKASGYNFLRLSFPGAAFASTGRAACFNLSTGALGVVQSGVTAVIEDWGNGIYRCSISATANASSSGDAGCTVNNANDATLTTYAGDGTSGILVWGGQHETGLFVTSYIPTAAAAVTRAADTISITSSAMPMSATGWTVIVEGTYIVPPANDATDRRAWTLSDGTANESNYLQRTASGTTLQSFMLDGGAAQIAALGTDTITQSTTFKHAISVAANDIAKSFNGAAVSTDTSASLPTVDRLYIGANFDGSANHWMGYIRRIIYLPRALSDAELQAMTA